MTSQKVHEAPPQTGRSGVSVGTGAPRKEDERLLRGAGRFTGDIYPGHVAEMAVARCPFPHARINHIDASAALQLPGVYHVLTGKDVVSRSGSIGLLRPDPLAPEIPFYALAQDRATYEGQGVASVVAVTRHIAEDALELLDIDYEPLPSVTDVETAMALEAPVIYPDVMGSNLLADTEEGRGDVARQFRAAEVVVEGRFVINRVSGLPMETRAVLAEWQRGSRELTVHVSTQVPHVIRRQLAELLGWSRARSGWSPSMSAAASASSSASTRRTSSPHCMRWRSAGRFAGWRTATSTSGPPRTRGNPCTTTGSPPPRTGESWQWRTPTPMIWARPRSASAPHSSRRSCSTGLPRRYRSGATPGGGHQ